MPTLLERTQALSRRIEAYKALRDGANAVTELRARATDISALHGNLASLAASRKLLVEYGVDLKRQPKPSAAVAKKAESLRLMFIDDPLSLTRESAQFGPTFKRPLQDLIGKLQAALLDRWQSYVDSKLPTINERILETFGTMGFSTEVAKIKILLAQAKTLRDSLPTLRQTFRDVDKLAADLNAVWRNLDEIPADVRNFFRLAANRDAKLEDLTEPIRAWLKEHNLMGMLRLGLAK